MVLGRGKPALLRGMGVIGAHGPGYKTGHNSVNEVALIRV